MVIFCDKAKIGKTGTGTVGLHFKRQQSSDVDAEWYFSDLDPNPTSQLVSDPIWIFSNKLDINFTLLLLPRKCVMYSCLVSVLGCSLEWDISLLGEYLFDRQEFIFLIEHCCRGIVRFYQFFGIVLLQIQFGSRAARIRIHNDFSGSVSGSSISFGDDRIRIHNTATKTDILSQKSVNRYRHRWWFYNILLEMHAITHIF